MTRRVAKLTDHVLLTVRSSPFLNRQRRVRRFLNYAGSMASVAPVFINGAQRLAGKITNEAAKQVVDRGQLSFKRYDMHSQDYIIYPIPKAPA